MKIHVVSFMNLCLLMFCLFNFIKQMWYTEPCIFNYAASLHLLCFSFFFGSRAVSEQACCSAGDAPVSGDSGGGAAGAGLPQVEHCTGLQAGQEEEKGGSDGEKDSEGALGLTAVRHSSSILLQIIEVETVLLGRANSCSHSGKVCCRDPILSCLDGFQFS